MGGQIPILSQVPREFEICLTTRDRLLNRTLPAPISDRGFVSEDVYNRRLSANLGV